MAGEMVMVGKDDLAKMIVGKLTAANLPPDQAAIVADVLVYAELRGVASHGAVRVEHYANRIRRGGINLSADFAVEFVRPSMGRLDAKGGMGHVATYRAAEAAVKAAKTHGMAVVGVRNNSHNGVMAYYAAMALKEKFACFICSNVNSLVAPFGGSKPFLGSNPLAFAFPGRRENILLDMATSQVAFGKLLSYRAAGMPIPNDWAFDEAGNPTTNAEKAVTLAAFGGPKGYGISVMLEALTGLMVGGVFGPHLSPMYADLDKTRDLATFIWVIDPSVFYGEAFLDTAQAMIDELHAQPTAPGFDKVLVPGEIEENNVRRYGAEGIPVPKEIYGYLAG